MRTHNLKLACYRTALLALACAVLTACAGMQRAEPVTWIDVRTPAEYAEGHLPGATNIPHSDIVAGVSRLELSKDAPIQLYCRSGRRSGIAQQALEEAGYTRVTNAGGLDDALEATGLSATR